MSYLYKACKATRLMCYLGIGLLFLPFFGLSQSNTSDSLLREVTLENAIGYAVKNQPLVRQAQIDEEITKEAIKSRLSEWYPQISFDYYLQHNFQVQTSIFNGTPQKVGSKNLSATQFSVSQNIFNRDALLALRTRGDVLLQTTLTTSSNKIDVAANVAKAFFNVLTTYQQINIAQADIIRNERSLKDAYNQYTAGITDKIDYKRATINLNNLKASLKGSEELLKGRLEYLKFLMGYPVSGELHIIYDSTQMEREVAMDTLTYPDFNGRIEYRLLENQKRLLESNLRYQHWSYLPSVAVNGGYNLNYLNNKFGKLYSADYPNSFAALTLSVPIFQGGKRKADIRQAEWQLKRVDLDIVNLRENINSEYQQAMASYKSNLAFYLAQKENVSLAEEVYNVIQLQYRSGIKTYLEVITAETDLRTAKVNYFNALFQLLSSKTDVQKALGQINY